MLVQAFLYQTPHQYSQKPSPAWIGKKTFQLHKGPYSFFGPDFGICVAQNQRTFEDQSLIEIKKISALVNDWEKDNAYGKNPSKVRP